MVPCGRETHAHIGKLHNCAAARIRVPALDSKTGASSGSSDLCVYSAHFDPHFTGIRGRVRQFRALTDDVARRVTPPASSASNDRVTNSSPSSSFARAPCVLAGDFNTIADGYKRLIPQFCCDDLRFGSLGKSEPQWWLDNVLNQPDASGENRSVHFHPLSFNLHECFCYAVCSVSSLFAAQAVFGMIRAHRVSRSSCWEA